MFGSDSANELRRCPGRKRHQFVGRQQRAEDGGAHNHGVVSLGGVTSEYCHSRERSVIVILCKALHRMPLNSRVCVCWLVVRRYLCSTYCSSFLVLKEVAHFVDNSFRQLVYSVVARIDHSSLVIPQVAHPWASEGGEGAHSTWIWMFAKCRSFMASRLFTICVK